MFFLSARKYDPGFSSRIRIRIFYPRIQGSKGHHFSDPQRLQNFSPRSYQKKCFSPKIKSKDVLTRGQRQYADPGSGVLLTPGSGMGKKSGSGSRIWIEQPGSCFRELKYLKFFDADPGWKKLRSEIENIRIRDKHPGSATMGKSHIKKLYVRSQWTKNSLTTQKFRQEKKLVTLVALVRHTTIYSELCCGSG